MHWRILRIILLTIINCYGLFEKKFQDCNFLTCALGRSAPE